MILKTLELSTAPITLNDFGAITIGAHPSSLKLEEDYGLLLEEVLASEELFNHVEAGRLQLEVDGAIVPLSDFGDKSAGGDRGLEIFSTEGGEGGYNFSYDGDAEMVELVNSSTFAQTVSGAGLDSFQVKAKTSATLTKLNNVWYPSTSTTEPYYKSTDFNATSSWTDQGDTYRVTINLSGFPNDYSVASVDIRDSNGKAVFADNTVNSNNSITIDASKSPDARFAGTVKVVIMK